MAAVVYMQRCKFPVFLLTILFINCGAGNLFAQFENTGLVVQYDSAWTYKKLKLIPVRYDHVPGPGASAIDPGIKIMTLSDAMKQKKIKVRELPPNVGADVAVLKVQNESKDYILINSGEVITGGKQDRASGETVLLPPEKEDYYLKSYCVEKGRWAKKEKPFKYFRPADINIKKSIDIEKNQAHVWQEIDRQFKATKLESETWAYPEVVLKNQSLDDSGYIKWFTEKFSNSDSGYAGFIAVTADRIIATDLYATSQLTNNAFQAILHTYVKNAVTFGERPTIKDEVVRQFMQPIFSDAKTRKEFLAKHGTTHYFKGKAIHIVAYGN
jgi:hypothetical protein